MRRIMDRRAWVSSLLDEAGRHHNRGRHERALRCEGAAAAVESEAGDAPPEDALPAWLDGWRDGMRIRKRFA